MSVFGVFSVRIQSGCGKIRTRKTPNTDNFHAMISLMRNIALNICDRAFLRKWLQWLSNIFAKSLNRTCATVLNRSLALLLLNYCLLLSKYETSYLYNSPIKLIILAGGNCKHLHLYFLNIAQISQNMHLENQERQNLKFSLVLGIKVLII